MHILSHRKSILPFAMSRTGVISSYRAHRHDFLELTFIHSGSGNHAIDGIQHPFAANDILFTPPSAIEEFLADGHTHDQTSVALYEEFFARHGMREEVSMLRARIASGVHTVSVPPDHAAAVERLINDAFREYIFKMHRYERILACRMAELLSVIERLVHEKRNVLARFNGVPPAIYAALERIESQYHIITSVDDMITTDMNKRYFIRLFKKHLRITPIQYLNRVRIEKCCELLSVKDAAVSDAAYQAGFNDLGNFNRLFRRFLGMTPRDFSRRVLSSAIDAGAINRFRFPLEKKR
ncbi:MAG: AraC family transcriptional regulator [Spirochaetes bacterium]|nr:AraC family transcriptional regulator [Spirochaetota bacterium]